jgi:ribosome-binding factor A
MSTFRNEKLSKLFRQTIAEFISQEMEFNGEILVTVANAQVTGDLNQARIWISVFPFAQSAEVLERLRRQTRFIKEFLNEKIKIRKIPNLVFLIDQTEEEAGKIEKEINEVMSNE